MPEETKPTADAAAPSEGKGPLASPEGVAPPPQQPRTYTGDEFAAALRSLEERTTQKVRSEIGRETARLKTELQAAKAWESMDEETRQGARETALLAVERANTIAQKYSLNEAQRAQIERRSKNWQDAEELAQTMVPAGKSGDSDPLARFGVQGDAPPVKPEKATLLPAGQGARIPATKSIQELADGEWDPKAAAAYMRGFGVR